MPDKPRDRALDKSQGKKKYNDLSKKLLQSKKSQNSLRSIRNKQKDEAGRVKEQKYSGRKPALRPEPLPQAFSKTQNRAEQKYEKSRSQTKKPPSNLPRIIIVAAAAVLMIAACYYALTYKNALEITVNGEPLAHIKTTKLLQEDFLKSLTAVIEQIEETKIMLTDRVELAPVHAKRKMVMDDSEIMNLLASVVNYKIMAAKISVDGVVIGTAANREEAEAILDAVKRPYTEGKSEILAEFVEDVSVTDEYVLKDEIISSDFIRTELTKTFTSEFEYIVESGDMLSTIASANGTTVSEIKNLNPDLDVTRPLQIGQRIVLSSTLPYISVKTTETVVETQDIPMPVIEQPDPSLTSGQRRIIQPGSPGKKEVSTQIIKINGVVASRGEPQETITEQAVSQIVSVGTN